MILLDRGSLLRIGIIKLLRTTDSNYIVDFISRKLKLIIEIDGSSHLTKGLDDYKRQLKLEGLGFTVLRFSEYEVLGALEDVHNKIYYAIEAIEEKLNLNKT